MPVLKVRFVPKTVAISPGTSAPLTKLAPFTTPVMTIPGTLEILRIFWLLTSET